MFQHMGIWLPDGEKHFPDWMTKHGDPVDGKGTYQIKKLRAALGFCTKFRTAVDVGGHVGLWSMHLVKRFQSVHAFEPMQQFRECFLHNIVAESLPEGVQLALHSEALGALAAKVHLKYDPADSGGTHIDDRTPLYKDGVDMVTLDSMQLVEVDFIKLDCEGYEHHVIEGGEDTIRRQKPTIIVEQKQHKLGPNFGIKGTPAVDLLKRWGYRVRASISGDFILTP